MLKLPAKLILRTRIRPFCQLLLAGLLCVLAAFFFIRNLVKPFTGLIFNSPEVRVESGKVIFAPRAADSPARRAGLIPERDQILEIDQQPIRSVRELVVWEAGHYSFEPVVMTVRNEGNAPRTVVIKPQLSVAQNDWFSILFFIVILGGIALYLLTHYQNEITQIVFAFLALLYMVYTSVLPFYYESLFTMIFVNLGEQTAWLVLIFLTFFQKDVLSARMKKILIVCCSSVFTFFMVFRFYQYFRWLLFGWDGIYRDLQFVVQLQNQFDVLAYVFFLIFLVYIYTRSRHRELKRHIEWITAGALLSLPPHFFFNQLPQIFRAIQNNPDYMGSTANFFLAFLPLSYLIGLVRSRGYQIKVLRSRTVIYITVAFALLALFAILFNPTQRLFTDVLGLHPEISGFLVALSLFIALLYLQLIIFLVVDHRLWRERNYEKSQEETSFLERARPSPSVRYSQSKENESKLLLTGIMGRFDAFSEQAKKACLVIKKLKKKGAGREKNAARKEKPEEHGIGPADKILSFIQKSVVSFGQFRKRFETILKRQPSIRISLALDPLIDSVVNQSQRQWSGIAFECQRQPGVKVFCSPEDIALCLSFVIENAYEALARKTDSIVIAVHPHQEYVTIEIADKGIGIPLKNTLQVGQPFFTTKRNHEGLGMYFVKTLLERNNGSFSVEPGIETGTRIFLHIPRTNKAAGALSGKGG